MQFIIIIIKKMIERRALGIGGGWSVILHAHARNQASTKHYRSDISIALIKIFVPVIMKLFYSSLPAVSHSRIALNTQSGAKLSESQAKPNHH
jgi:hypothetical protein